MRRPGRRGWVAIGLVAVGLAGLVAWARHDPWPALRVLPALDDVQRGPIPFTGDGRAIAWPDPGPTGVVAWDPATGRAGPPRGDPTVLWEANAPDGRSCLGFRYLAGDPPALEVVRVDVGSGAVTLRLPAPTYFSDRLDLAVADDGRAIRALDRDGHGNPRLVVTWDVATGRMTEADVARPPGGWPLAYSAAAGLIACTTRDRGLLLWDATANREAGRLAWPPGMTKDSDAVARFTPNGRALIVAQPDGRVDSLGCARPAARPVAAVARGAAGPRHHPDQPRRPDPASRRRRAPAGPVPWRPRPLDPRRLGAGPVRSGPRVDPPRPGRWPGPRPPPEPIRDPDAVLPRRPLGARRARRRHHHPRHPRAHPLIAARPAADDSRGRTDAMAMAPDDPTMATGPDPGPADGPRRLRGRCLVVA